MERSVVARNFPQAWLSTPSLAHLPQKVEKLLERIGRLEEAPVISKGPNGLEALSRFGDAQLAEDAVATLHGTDLRSSAEKEAAGGRPPKESERFWLQIAKDVLPAAAAASAPPGAPIGRLAATAPAIVEATAPRRSKIIPTGIVLSPLPAGWTDKDVILLARPYGHVKQVRVQKLTDGQTGALINFSLEESAANALGGLNGLSLMGMQLRCTMQEEVEAPRALQRAVVFLDELVAVADAATALPRLDDCEVYVSDLPKSARSEVSIRALFPSGGAHAEVWQIHDANGVKPTGRAYIRFRHHPEAVAAVRSSAAETGGPRVSWSESERASRGTRGAYGVDVVRRVLGEGSARLQEVRKAAGLGSIAIAGLAGSAPCGAGAEAAHVHFVVRCEHASQVDIVRKMIAEDLAKVHELHKQDVQGSLVLRGFASSWSEKGLRFVFAPFGGLSSVALELDAEGTDGAATRVAYVRLKNHSAVEKAVNNLHLTKVGDGEMVESCVVECQRWNVRGWSDGTMMAGFFVDQLAMPRRPLDTAPGPEDRELFVQNLPLQDMDRKQLKEYFEGFGEVEDLNLIKKTFSEELTGEGYIRFKQHRDAQRCIEALTPSNLQDADPMDLTGSWSESERVLQRKLNCYRFSLISELVGADGLGLVRLKEEAKLQGLWVLSENLQQKDHSAPPLMGRQLQFVGKVSEEANVRLFREVLERTLEDVHTRIADRLEKRRRKAEAAAAATPAQVEGNSSQQAAAAMAVPGAPQAPAWAAPASAAAPPSWGQQPAAPYWPGTSGAWPAGQAPAGVVPPPATASAWGAAASQAVAQAPATASVFEMPTAGADQKKAEGGASARSRSRRRRRGGAGDGEDRRRSGSRRHRRRRRGGGADPASGKE